MEFKQITDLIKLINKSDLTEFKMKQGEFELIVRTDKYQRNKPVVGVPQVQPNVVPTAYVPEVQAAPVEKPIPDFAPAQTAESTSGDLLEVRSPMVGTFYRSPSPDKAPYVKVGDSVEEGEVVCIIEAMKLFNEIESEISGKIAKILVDDASPVEYDQVLFLVEP